MRLTQLDAEYTPVTYMIRNDDSNELQEYPSRKSFRKELGNARLINARTGQVYENADLHVTGIIQLPP